MGGEHLQLQCFLGEGNSNVTNVRIFSSFLYLLKMCVRWHVLYSFVFYVLSCYCDVHAFSFVFERCMHSRVSGYDHRFS